MVEFHCSPFQNEPKIFVQRMVNSKCSILVDVFTSVACPHTVSCHVPNTDLDLSPLMNNVKNYHVRNLDGSKENIMISVCGPLKYFEGAKPNTECPMHSAVCLQDHNHQWKVIYLGRIYIDFYMVRICNIYS